MVCEIFNATWISSFWEKDISTSIESEGYASKTRHIPAVRARSTDDKDLGPGDGPPSSSSCLPSTKILGCGCSPLSIFAVYEDVVPSIIPSPKNIWPADASLSRREFVTSICFKALYRLERRQGSLTAMMCFDSVIDEHKPFGEPKSRMERR
jgi:hypothetical protein